MYGVPGTIGEHPALAAKREAEAEETGVFARLDVVRALHTGPHECMAGATHRWFWSGQSCPTLLALDGDA